MSKSLKVAWSLVLSLALVSMVAMFAGCTKSDSKDDTTPAVSSAKAITAFSFTTPAATGTIVESAKTITVAVPAGTNVTALVATFTSTGATTKVGATSQVSGTTANDFTAPVVYTVTAADGSSTAYTVTVTIALATYSGRVYMATEMGGHIAFYDLTIDPNNTTTPITITNGAGKGDKKQLQGAPGDTISHIFHDVRYDDAAKKVYYSTIVPDGALLAAPATNLNTAHIGFMDLNASNAVTDATIDVEVNSAKNVNNLIFPVTGDKVVGLPVIYCASGQGTVAGTDYYVALSMTVPAYIDAIKKSDITAGADLSAKRVRFHVEDFRNTGNPATSWNDLGVSLFAHGMTSSPDGSKLYVVVNEVTVTDYNAATFTPTGYPKGSITGYLLNMQDVVTAGSVTSGSVKAQHTITGLGGSSTTAPTVAFRAGWTPDGSKILQSGKDRFLVLDGATLAPLNTATGDMTIGGGKLQVENHDAMSTSDGKYAVLTIRYEDTDTGGNQTSGLQLYDLTTMKPVGGMTSTCSKCHTTNLATKAHLTCGIDGKLSKN